MPSTSEEREFYEKNGFLCVPGAFTEKEVSVLLRGLERDEQIEGPHRILERRLRADDKAPAPVRALYASHLRQKVFSYMMRDPRVLRRVFAFLGRNVYPYQFKTNLKLPFGGERWAWHQDYPAWRIMDDLPTPSLISVALFLDDVTEFNGPIIFVPGSHRCGTLTTRLGTESPRSTQHLDPYDIALTEAEMSRLDCEHGMDAPKGPAGTIVFFHPEIVHGSATNISPRARRVVIVTYNKTDNLPRRNERAEHLVLRDTAELEPLQESFLSLSSRTETGEG